MRKDFALPALALVSGAAGFAVRLWQRSSALDPTTNLFTHGAPATWALLALTAVVAVLALVLCSGGRTISEEEADRAFQCSSTGYMTLMVVAGMGFLVSAAAGVPQLMEDLQAWQADPSRHLLPAAVRDHHEGSRRVGALRLPAQAVLGLRLQRDGPVRQPELMGRKVHIVPSEALDLLPGQPLPPGQAEDQPRRRLRLLRQKLGHGPGIRPSHGYFAHVPSPPGQGER